MVVPAAHGDMWRRTPEYRPSSEDHRASEHRHDQRNGPQQYATHYEPYYRESDRPSQNGQDSRTDSQSRERGAHRGSSSGARSRRRRRRTQRSSAVQQGHRSHTPPAPSAPPATQQPQPQLMVAQVFPQTFILPPGHNMHVPQMDPNAQPMDTIPYSLPQPYFAMPTSGIAAIQHYQQWPQSYQWQQSTFNNVARSAPLVYTRQRSSLWAQSMPHNQA